MLTNTSASFFQELGRGSHPEILPELHEHMSLVCLHCTSLHFRGSLVTQSKLVQGVTENFGDEWPVAVFSAELDGIVAEILRPNG